MNRERYMKLSGAYGKATVIISALCLCCFLINSVFVDSQALAAISENRLTAYLLNFLAGCNGILGEVGAMSYSAVFLDRQLWRVVSYVYLHAGVFHLLLNILALLFVGKAMENKLGSIRFALLFHALAIVDALVICIFFSHSTSVGASAGIFAMLGAFFVLLLRRDAGCWTSLSKGKLGYLIGFAVLSNVFGMETLASHLLALVMGGVIGLFLPVSRRSAV